MPLVSKTFSQIITFTRASTATYFDATGTLQSAAINAPRFDYDPDTLAARGFLIEEARTNSIRNNTMQGAVAGTPGTAPTNWDVVVSGSGITREVVGTGTEDGITYVDLRFYGTGSGSAAPQIRPETTTSIVSAVGQTWTASYYLRIVGGSTTGITSWAQIWQERDAAGVALTTAIAIVSVPTTAALKTQRSVTTRTLTDAAAVRLTNRIQWAFVDGVAVDITLRIGLPQLENNNISTGVASATVAAGGSGYAVGDVLQIVGGTGTAARLTVATLSGSAVATVTVSTAGSYSVFPSPQPVSVTAITGTGTSATFNIVPQAQSGFATSVIPTTTTALTRSADVATVNTLSPWYNATEGTLFVDSSFPLATFGHSAELYQDASNTIVLRANSPNTQGVILVGGSAVFVQNIANVSDYKGAIAYKLNDAAASINGSVPVTDTSVTLPTPTSLQLGRRADGIRYLNGYLRRITYYPRRLSNAELQGITA